MNFEAVKSMKGNRGRMITQGNHAVVHTIWDAGDRFPLDLKNYRNQKSAFKITLVVPTEQELKNLYDSYHDICGVSLVMEHGNKTNGEVNEKVTGITCLGIGPIDIDLVGDDLNILKPFL
jgi:peptidyl-tRNA hydrolase